VKISQKVLGGYFFDSHCRSDTAAVVEPVGRKANWSEKERWGEV